MKQAKNVVQGTHVTVIDPRAPSQAKLRVAAYARVSSDSEDQINSYLAQVDFYTKYISTQENWEMVDVYADEGLSGMDAKKRDEFNRMIADCRDGKIDRILVKSVSRFARNQEDYIFYMRELLRLGVTIRFEKENVDTGKMTSEQIADIYGAFAQMETTGHSANMRISNRIRMEKGMFVPSSPPFGYRLVNRKLEIIPEEAEIVRRIYNSYLRGQGKDDIAKELNRRGVKRDNTTGRWHSSTVEIILRNITYTGNQIWQKTYATDVIPFRQVINHGEKPKYYAEDCCPAIISKDDFDRVQELFKSRNKKRQSGMRNASPYDKRIYCAQCGSACRRKSCNEKIYWLCRKHNHDKTECPVGQTLESDITAAIQRFYHKIWYGRNSVLKPVLEQLTELRERELRSDRRVHDIDKELAQLTEQNLVLTRLKSKGYVDPALYLSQMTELDCKVRELRKLRRKVMERSGDDRQIRQTEAMLDYLEDSPEWLEEITPELFEELIDKLFLTVDGTIKIRLLNGLEVRESVGNE